MDSYGTGAPHCLYLCCCDDMECNEVGYHVIVDDYHEMRMDDVMVNCCEVFDLRYE